MYYSTSYVSSTYLSYVKKEDAKEIIKKRQVIGWVFGLCFVVLFSTLEIYLYPKLINLASEAKYQMPIYFQSTVRYLVYSVAIILSLVIKPESEADIDSKLRSYKSGEMILMSKLVDRKYEYGLILLLFAVIAYIIFVTILPIYDITSQV